MKAYDKAINIFLRRYGKYWEGTFLRLALR